MKTQNRTLSKTGTIAALAGLSLLVLRLAASAETASDLTTRYDPKLDAAVDRGLAYLASVQAADGSLPGAYGKSTAIPSLCGMAFLARGNTPGYGPYGAVINRCIDYVLLSYEKPKHGFAARTGLLAHGEEGHGYMYGHNIATLFLCEISGMVDRERQARLDEVLPKAVQIILAAQSVPKAPGHKGGWRYTKASADSDMSCSGWALMALRSARLNGVPVPDSAIEDAVAYILRHRNPSNGGFGYQNTAARVTLTGAALLCLELTGHHGDPVTAAAGQYILSARAQIPAQGQAAYGLYYTSQGMFQLGGGEWDAFASWMYEFYLPRQAADGSWPGSRQGSLAYETAMTLLALEVHYRQLPIYQRDENLPGGE